MAKVFNVEQLRIGGHLLTGSAEGLFYDADDNGFGEQLAQGTQAVPTNRTVQAGKGLKWLVDGALVDTVDLTLNRVLDIEYDNSTIGINEYDMVYVKAEGITGGNLHTDIPGLGLRLGDTAGAVGEDALHVGAGSGLAVEGDYVNIKSTNNDTEGAPHNALRGIIGKMIQDDTINNRSLKTISEANLVDGSVKLHGVGGLEHLTNANSSLQGLNIINSAITPIRLHANTAGAGLVLDTTDGLAVLGNSGIHVQGDYVNIANHISDDNLRVIAGGAGSHADYIKDGSIDQDKLEQLTDSEKVAGSAVELNVGGGLGDNTDESTGGLYILDDAIGKEQLDATDVAGSGLFGDGGMLNIGGGSGLHAEGDYLNISTDGVDGTMIAEGSVGNLHIDTANKININRTNMVAGAGLKFLASDAYSNTIDVIGGDGIVTAADEIYLDTDVVRTTGNQVIDGEKSFLEIVDFLSGITVAGDLEVRGSTLVTQVNEVNIGDALIVLNAGYTASSPPDAGIEIERGTKHNARIMFEDDDDVWKAGKAGEESELLTAPRVLSDTANPETKVGSFFISKNLYSGVTRESMLFSLHNSISTSESLYATPHVVVSLENTVDPDAELLGCMVTKVNTTGFNVDLTAKVPATSLVSDYKVKAWVSVTRT